VNATAEKAGDAAPAKDLTSFNGLATFRKGIKKNTFSVFFLNVVMPVFFLAKRKGDK